MNRSAAPDSTRWWALAPFGRLGHLVGFRWVYPFGTLPIPFHPLFLPVVLLTLLGWVVWRIVTLVTAASPESAWGSALTLLAGAMVVGLGLSVPVLAWVVLVLGGRLIQAALVLASMIVLTISATSGGDAVWVAVVPAVFFLTWAAQATSGRVLRARLKAAVNQFVPVDGRGRAVILGRSADAEARGPLMDHAGTAAVWVQSPRDGHRSRGHFRVTPDLATLVLDLARGELPQGATLRQNGDHFVLECLTLLPEDAIWVEAERHVGPTRIVGDLLHRVTFEDTHWSRSVVTGRVSTVLPLPLAQCFHWVSLTSRSEWVVAFARGKPREIGPGPDALHRLFAPAPPAEHLGAPALDGVLRPLKQAIDERDAAIDTLRAATLNGPVDVSVHREALAVLRRGGRALLGDDAPQFLTAWMKQATLGRQQDLPSTIAQLIDKLSDDEITAHGALFLDTFNSRKLGLEWTLGPDLDPAPLPKDLYRFGTKAGFGLVFRHPALYVRMGDLLPPFRDLLAALAKEMALPDLVLAAQARWSGGGDPVNPP